MPNYNPRHVYVVSFDSANTDLYYFCSHDDIVLSGVSESNIFRGVLVNPSTRSQSLNPIRANSSIGNISFAFSDTSQNLSSLLNSKLTSSPSQGLRAKRVQHWVGEAGSVWSSGYKLLQTQQFYNSIGWSDNNYIFNAQDIQRSELKDIFDTKKTTLTSSLTLTTTTITVNSSNDFSLVNHGGGYSDAPNSTVLYLKIEDEIIRCTAKPSSTSFTIDNAQSTLSAAASTDDTVLSVTDHSSFNSSGVGYVTTGSPQSSYAIRWTGKTDSPHQLTGVTGVTTGFDNGATIVSLNGRGALSSRVADHTVDSSQDADKRTAVEEYIYLEMPAVQLLYAILTGTVYGASPATTLPSHWNLGISAANWVATSEFISIGTDLWDTADDTAGFPLRFEGLKKTNAKSFIEKEILFICGLYTPILPTGELGLRRMSGVVSDSAFSRVLDESNIVSIASVSYDLDEIHNDFLIKWNYNPVSEKYTRTVNLTDTNSINIWGQARQLEIKSLGLKGSSHTDAIIGNLFNTWRDRYAGPPFKATIQLAYSERDIRVGDIVRIKLSNIPEFTDQNSSFGSLDISVEVQRIGINYTSGVVTIGVFGSTQRASPLVIGNPSLEDSFYTSQGSDMAAMVAASPQTITGTDSGGTLTITGNSSLTGVTDLNSATATTDNNQGIFYYNGDITINSGVTLTITNNIEIRCKGTFTNNGTIDGLGNGISGGATGTAGYIGSTRSSGGVYYYYTNDGSTNVICGGPDNTPGIFPGELLPDSTEYYSVTVNNASAGPFNIVNSGSSISGKPGDLRGSSGGKGGDNYLTSVTASGGNGGNGGAGLLIICRGAVGGSSSSIDLSGSDGSAGATSDSGRIYAGSGAGGYPGCLVVLLDGNTVTETISPYFTANTGDCPLLGTRVTEAYSNRVYDNFTAPVRSLYQGFQAESKSSSNLNVHYLIESQTAKVDTPEQTTLPTAISVTEHSNTQNAINVYGLEISATAPSDTSYRAARIYIRKRSTEGWQYVGEAASGEEVVFWVAADGSTYDIKAHSVSITNVESDDYIERAYTVQNGITTQIGNFVIDGSNLIVYNASSPREEIQKIDLVSTGVMTGTILGSGDQANEQLVPNNRFNFLQNSPQQPMAWRSTEWSNEFLDIHYITTDSPDTEGSYLVLPNPPTSSPINKGYNVSCKTFKLVPGRKYRARIRARAVNVDSPIDTDGFYFRLQYGINYAEYFGFDGPTADPPVPYARDGYNDFIEGTETVLTELWDTYEYDITIPATYDWGNIAVYNWNHSNAEFHVAWVEFMPWGVLQQYVADFEDDYPFFHIPIWQSAEFIDTTSVGTNSTSLAGTGGLRIQVDLTSTSNYEAGDITLGKSNTDLSWDSEQDWKLKVLQIPSGSPLPSTNDFWVFRGSWTAGVINGCGFWYDQSAKQWYTFTGQNTASITTTAISPLSDPSLIRIVIDNQSSPREVRFYVDGTLVATHTDDIPSGTGTGYQHVLGYYSDSETGGGSTNTVFLGEFKFKWN